MYNPFVETISIEEDDKSLIQASLVGDRGARGKLILRHQAWIYNIAIKMVMDPDKACDVTQEILIKVITRLSSYRSGLASFMTWLYRIVANHVIKMKKTGHESRKNYTVEEYFYYTERLPDDMSFAHPDYNLVLEEAWINCMTSMILCFNRRERLVFILDDVFNVTDFVGSEIMKISKANFRKILSMSREKLFSCMYETCSFMNEDAPCKCRNKLKVLIEKGLFDPEKLVYYKKNSPTINDIIEKKVNEFMEIYHNHFLQLFREQPFYEAPHITEWVKTFIQRDDFENIFIVISFSGMLIVKKPILNIAGIVSTIRNLICTSPGSLRAPCNTKSAGQGS